MGKVVTAEAKRKKKKGRPSLSDLRKRALLQQDNLIDFSPDSNGTPTRRSTNQNPNFDSPASDFIGDGEDDDDERKEKKVKLVVRLPQSNHHFHHSSSLNSASCGSDSYADDENHEPTAKIRKIDDRSGDFVSDQGEKVSKATDTQLGSPLESGPTTPLPDKKLLVFILDRLQKKDTYGVFSEPVDPNELPDYHEIIEQPMDFRTVRKKLDEALYRNLEELEADVYLICSNAMQYNAPDTVYFRQARSIQELAKRDFDNLRQEGDDGEPQPKVVRRGRPPSKNLKKSVTSSPIDRVGPEFSSDATLATAVDDTAGSNSYNLRRGPISYRFRSTDVFVSSNRARSSENYNDSLINWNDEFPASILKADMKYGNKHFVVDESRRDTYKQFHTSASGHEPYAFSLVGEKKQMAAVGLHFEHGYARSLARFAANLGPNVWKIASEKIISVLPAGVKFGPGWVGENSDSSQPQSSSNNAGIDSRLITQASVSNSTAAIVSSFPFETNRKSDSKELPVQTQQVHLNRNGINHGVFGQMGKVEVTMPTGPSEDPDAGSRKLATPDPGFNSHIYRKPSWQFSLPVSPDLNVGFKAPGSPSSSVQIGSPQQPDLALQL